jgi:hypothetical protein
VAGDCGDGLTGSNRCHDAFQECTTLLEIIVVEVAMQILWMQCRVEFFRAEGRTPNPIPLGDGVHYYIDKTFNKFTT